MPLDHYISQTYLKQFYSPKLNRQMYAIRKSDLKLMKPNSKSICRIENGSTNEYLPDARAIEDFLVDIEPKYNTTLEKLEKRIVDIECIYTIAGFVAFVSVCSPTGMRLHSYWLKKMIEITGKIFDSAGKIPQPPAEFKGNNFTELLDNGEINIEVDPKYPQAIGITKVLSLINIFGNSKWDIIQNRFPDSPFFSSDYPIAIEETENSYILNKIIPLSPTLAIKIYPDPNVERKYQDFLFSRFSYRFVALDRNEIININRLIVRSAETLVLFRDYLDWIPNFVAKNSKYRIEPLTKEIKSQRGSFLFSTHRIARTDDEKKSS